MERAADILRLLAWAVMVGGYGLMLWALSGSAYADKATDAPCRTAAFVGDTARKKAARHSEHPEARP